jgi:hypothetical protein
VFKIEFEDRDGRLDTADRELARQICTAADAELHALLPTLIDSVDLRIATGSDVIPTIGYGARAMTFNSIAFTFDPYHPTGIRSVFEKFLRPALFHECHHLVRGWVKRGGKRRAHFIEGVICEGLASAFERDAAGHEPPWCSYPENVREWVSELLRLPASAPYAEWMFMHPDGRRWIGYRAGTFIADRAIAASGRSAAELAETDYAEVLKLARLPLPACARQG